jgi:agmatine deiminase
MSATETQGGLRMPAEWEPHESTWLAWPHYQGDWPGKFAPIPWVYAEVIRNLARHERVDLIVSDAPAERRARKILDKANSLSDNIRFHRWPTDRVWTRDSGCTFVISTDHVRAGAPTRPDPEGRDSAGSEKTHEIPQHRGRAALQRRVRRTQSTSALAADGGLSAITWRFNAWAKYSNWKHDQKISSLMAQSARAREIHPVFRNKLVVLEGGSIDVNGRGTLLTTEECLLSKIQQRNPGMNRAAYEKLFGDYLGIKNVIWLASGIIGDDTHGHVDDLTRFVSPDTVVTVVESDPNDANYEPLRENIRRLRAASTENGNPLSIVELPMPQPVVFAKRRLPASYANFYIANGLVLVPVFNDPNDRVALDILADLFPDREIVGIYSGDLVWGFGTLHCMTQQQPAVSL